MCGTEIRVGAGRFAVGDDHYHPECYDVKRAKATERNSK
jgi:hypothetical protein